jgi:hypothetical protein
MTTRWTSLPWSGTTSGGAAGPLSTGWGLKNHLSRHRLKRPLTEARIGLLSTAGAHLAGEDPIPASGPPRVIPVDAAVAFHHIGYDTKRASADSEVAWPVRTLRRLADLGVIGSVSERAVSMMGAVLDGRVVLDRHVPAAVGQFRRDGVDLVLLVPA